MNIKLLPPALLLIAWIGGCIYLNNRYCCGTQSTGNDLLSSTISAVVLLDGVERVASSNETFYFSPSSSRLPEPLSSELKNLILSTATYLKNNPSRRMLITGVYTTDEKNIHPELGLERAAVIQSLLLDEGIPAIQIRTTQDISDELKLRNGRLEDTMRFSFEAMPEREALFDEMKNRLSSQKITLHFELAEKELSLNPAQRKFFQDLLYYVNETEGQKVRVVGYTDNQGEPRQNYGLGRERAVFVEDYLAGLGFDKSKIITDSLGEADPISTNDTEEGRAKNRRVEVMLN